MWTRFMDMHSGGGAKEKQEYIYIEADEVTAVQVFERVFGHNPNHVTCSCCGEDYSINSDNLSLEEATEYERRGMPLEEYIKRPDVLVVRQIDREKIGHEVRSLH